ncbi:NAD-dependent epimerase/dehydratase family protein [Rubritalea marina]|uniref:NAD-dependent epimerase/dehydratase family protein n=1 Tax=Rubritalea marina TaxID=361055 RepID=UPI000373C0FD|nr:NAD(P)-dependent oxidoreductase [Rubritalea marina]
MTKVLLIGGTGCVGTATAYALNRLEPSAEIFILSRKASNANSSKKYQYVVGDILDPESLIKVLEEHKITHVMHSAALRTKECSDNPSLAFEVNVKGTQNVIDAIKAVGGIERLVFTSTAAVYAVSDSPSFMTKEAARKALLNPYTATKLAAEALLEGNAYHAKQPTTILRPQIIYGPHRLSEGSTAGVTAAILAAKKGKKYTIPFGGTTGFHYSADVGLAHALALMIDNADFACYNLVAESLSVADICYEINRYHGKELVDHIEKPYPFQAGIDSSSFEQAFPNFKQTTFRKAVEIMSAD